MHIVRLGFSVLCGSTVQYVCENIGFWYLSQQNKRENVDKGGEKFTRLGPRLQNELQSQFP